MPARIWVGRHTGWAAFEMRGDAAYVKADIAERMAEALEDWLNYAEDNLSEFDLEECFADAETTLCPRCQISGCINMKIRSVRSALSAFKDSAQDRGAS